MMFVRWQALNRRFGELEGSMKRIASEWRQPESLAEVRDDFPGLDLAVYSADGRLIASPTARIPPITWGRLKTGDVLVYGLQDEHITFVGSASWVETEAGLRQLALVLTILWFPLTLSTAAVAWYGGGLVLRPVQELVESAQRLSGSSEGGSLRTTDRAEFGTLASSLNDLIVRVRSAAAIQEQFASDAAHELRSPLALLRTLIEANLMRKRSAEEHVASQTAALKQVDRLIAIVEALLNSARHHNTNIAPLDFGDSVRKRVVEWAEASGWPESRLMLQFEACKVQISDEEVCIVIRNLLDNSARNSTHDTPIEVKVTCAGDVAVLTVRDYGIGLSQHEMGLAFERFYRSDEGRSRQHGGAGIGLAVVRRIIESRSGSVGFVDVERGALIAVMIPVISI